MKEVWKDVPGYEGIYQVNNIGDVKSLDHFVSHSDGKNRIQKGRMLKKDLTKKGYHRVTLSKECKKFRTFTHRLVALAFIPNPYDKPQVNHINGIKTDNRVENLEWVTNQENQIHAQQNGLVKNKTGENHHNSKISNKDAEKIRHFRNRGVKIKHLSNAYKISETAVCNIVSNKSYSSSS